jgi:hypothetical protein
MVHVRTFCNLSTSSHYFYIIKYTVKPVLRGHLWDKEKVAL